MLQVHDLWGLLGLLGIVALATTLTGHPNTAGDIQAVGNAFNGALAASEGSAR